MGVVGAGTNEAVTSLAERTDSSVPGAFPSSFVWGAATSAYQIEGSTNADGRGVSFLQVPSPRDPAYGGGHLRFGSGSWELPRFCRPPSFRSSP